MTARAICAVSQIAVFAVAGLLLAPGRSPAALARAAETDVVDNAINFPALLGRSDPVFSWSADSVPWPSNEGGSAFTGNGNSGLLVRSTGSNELRFTLGRTTLYDDRERGKNYTTGNFVVDRPRLPIGYLTLTLNGEVTNGTLRLHLYDGVVRGNITTTAGSVQLLVFTNANFRAADVHVLELRASPGEANASLAFTALAADAQQHNGVAYIPNPQPTWHMVGGINVTVWKHLSGKQHAVAVAHTQTAPDTRVAVFTTTDVVADATAAAVAQVQAAAVAGPTTGVLAAHTEWWHAFYNTTGFVSFTGHPETEQFFWISTYKMASTTREGNALFDLEGPWYIAYTPWPDLHWDLNIQEQYFPIMTGNQLNLFRPLAEALLSNMPNLIGNTAKAWQHDSAAVPTGASSLEMRETKYWHYSLDTDGTPITSPPWVTGNLLWVQHLYFLTYDYTRNTSLLREQLPLLQRAVNFHMHLRVDNGTAISLVETFSPEYAGGNNTMYDLALFKWGLNALLHTFDVLEISDPRRGEYEDTLARLVPYPTGPNGFLINSNTPLAPDGHRHYSHLFPIHPLGTLDLTQPANWDLAARSFDWWNTRGLASHFEVASTMSTHLADYLAVGPDGALTAEERRRRSGVMTNITHNIFQRFTPNTFYYEGSTGLCSETPAGTASALQDMMLMSTSFIGGKYSSTSVRVSVFPGLDDGTIDEAVFYKLRAAGGLAVTGRRANGSTLWVRLENVQSASIQVVLVAKGMALPWATTSQLGMVGGSSAPEATLQIAAGGAVTVYPKMQPPAALVVQEVAYPNASQWNAWGQKNVLPPPPPPPQTACSKYGSGAPGYTCHAGMCSTGAGGVGSPALEDCGKSLSEPALSCGSDIQKCLAQAATLCNATAGCQSFGLSASWGYSHVKLFRGGTGDLVPNYEWDVWVKA